MHEQILMLTKLKLTKKVKTHWRVLCRQRKMVGFSDGDLAPHQKTWKYGTWCGVEGTNVEIMRWELCHQWGGCVENR